MSGAPAGSAAHGNDWLVANAGGFPVGAAISTPAERDEVMGRALEHLPE